MTITYHPEVEQGSDEWLALRCGIITASNIKHLITPTELKPVTRKDKADRHKFAAHVYELAAQRMTKYVEPSYISNDMLRGMNDEIKAIELYSEKYAPVERIGFITNDNHGVTIGYSPDGLTHNRKRAVECKSRADKYQMECIVHREVPREFALQLQTGLMVGELEQIDFISYCGGMHMLRLEVFPDAVVQAAILEACQRAEEDIKTAIKEYGTTVAELGLYQTERDSGEEIFI